MVSENKVAVSILIPIKNEAANLHRCINSVKWADEIIVVDSQSTDGSIQIAEQLGVQVVQFYYTGKWPKKQNWALDNLPFRNDWVFILAADEALLPEAEEEFRQVIATNDHSAYLINRRFWFLDKWLEHAYFPNWNLRLFKHTVGRFEKLTEEDTASGDIEIHEHILVSSGSIGKLKTLMDHYAFPNIETFVEKHNRYSNWEARLALDREYESGQTLANVPELGTRRRLKRLYQKAPARPLIRFAYVYFWQKGFLDGVEGFYFACLHAFYEFLIVAKLFELRQRKVSNDSLGIGKLDQEHSTTRS